MFEQSMERARQAYATGRPAEAISALAAAGAEATTADQWRRIAGTHRRFGRLELAAAAFREVIGRQPDAADAYVHLALLQTWAAEDAEVRAMLALYRTMDAKARIPLGFALGKIYDDLGEIDRSFAHYDAAASSDTRLLARTDRGPF